MCEKVIIETEGDRGQIYRLIRYEEYDETTVVDKSYSYDGIYNLEVCEEYSNSLHEVTLFRLETTEQVARLCFGTVIAAIQAAGG